MNNFILCIMMMLLSLAFSSPLIAVNFESKVDSLLRKSHLDTQFHGTLIIKKGQQILYENAVGIANREWNIPHSMKSKFMIASITKQFTAYAVLKLESDGVLSTEDSIAKYIKLPKGSPIQTKKWQAITIHHLLTHTAGLTRDIKKTQTMSRSDYNLLGSVVSNSLRFGDIIERPPGRYHYSNMGYVFLAKVIERASKSTYGRYVKKIILNPLNLQNTGEYHRRKVVPFMSDGYYYDEMYKITKRCCDDTSVFIGSHHLYSNATDMLVWMNELQGQGAVLDKALLEKMKESQVSQDNEAHSDSTYGYGVMLDKFQGFKRVWHPGHEWGYSSLISYLPQLELTVIYLANIHGQDIFFSTPNSIKFLKLIVQELRD